MDQILDQFLNVGTIVLAVSVVILTFVVRRVVETAMPSLKKQADENAPQVTYATTLARWYQQLILYIIPVVVGGVIGWCNVPYFFNAEELTTTGSRVFFGGVVGWFSSFIYKAVRMALRKKVGIDIDPSSSMIPGASTSIPPVSSGD